MSDEPATASPKAETFQRFLDETGDTTFFGKGRVPILGQEGVSLCFCLGTTRRITKAAATTARRSDR